MLLPTGLVFPMNLAVLSNSWPADPGCQKEHPLDGKPSAYPQNTFSVKLPAALYQQHNLTQHKDDDVFFGERR